MPSADSILRLADLSYAAHVRRERDRQLARAIIDGVATACPFPVVVYWQADPMLLRVAAGSTTLARVSVDELRDRDERTAILYIVNRALLGYAALEPLEHDHTLGQD